VRSSHREVEVLDGWWHTWFDEGADWQNEAPLLPSTPLSEVPGHEPSVGWRNIEEGMESLDIPGTLAQSRPGYRGVVWHWRPLVVPDDWEGRAVRLRFGCARLRTEVYLENHLVGYDLEGYTPFEIDLTPYTEPGRRYELAVRVTNPGGVRAAQSMMPLTWSGREMLPDDDYGGLCGSISLIGTPPAFIADIHAMPMDESGCVTLRVELDNRGADCCRELRGEVHDAAGHLVACGENNDLDLEAGRVTLVDIPLILSDPQPWIPERPNLYTATVSLCGGPMIDEQRVTFGLRDAAHGTMPADWVRGLRAASTTNRYPGELPFASARMLDREMRAVQDLGFNALWADGQPFSEQSLAVADRMGILMCQSLGRLAAVPSFGDVEGQVFTRSLARERVRRLVQRDRNHPSLISWHVDGQGDMLAQGDVSDPMGLAGIIERHDGSRPLFCGTHRTSSDTQQPVLAVLESLTLDGVGLEDIPHVARRYGDRVLPGSDAARYAEWARTLEQALSSIGLMDGAESVSRLCRATWPMQCAALQALWDSGHGPAKGCIVSHWNDDPVRGIRGLVDIWRQAKVNR